MKTATILLIVMALCCPAYALSFMGPATTELSEGQSSLGFDYTFSEMDLEISGLGASWTEEFETDILAGKYSYGISDAVEGFIRLGLVNIELDDFDGDTGFAYWFGTKVNLGNYEGLDWGALFQIGWLEGDDKVTGFVPGFGIVTADQEIDIYEIQIAFGPTYDADGLKIYGGPFFHLVQGDYDVDVLGIGSGSFDIEEESVFGVYMGISAELTESAAVGVEFQFTGDAQAVGLRYVHRF